MNRDELRTQAKKLEAKVRAKTAEFEAGDITQAEFSSFIEKAHKQSKEVETTLKNYDRALRISAGNDRPSVGAEVERKSVDGELTPMTAKQFMAGHRALKSAASERVPNSTFIFDLALKGAGFESAYGDIVRKAQGETGLMGEDVSGTGSPAALGNGDYFLPGPAGPDILPQFIPGILELRWYQNVIAACFPTFPTSSPVVSYVREHSWTNNAAATGEGETFPTSTNQIQRYTEQVGKVSNIVRVTDEMIQDDNYFWALVQKRATMGVTREEEVQLLAGSGYPGVNGLLNRTTSFTQPQTVTALTNVSIPSSSAAGVGAGTATITSLTPGRQIIGGTGTAATSGGVAPTGQEIMVGVLSMLTDIRVLHFFEPSHIIMNPLDWFTVRTALDGMNNFMAGSPFGRNFGYVNNEVNPAVQAVDTALELWGKSVVTTPALPQGMVLVGDFPNGGQVLRRGGMRVEIVNTNGTDFEQGLWTMRAYTRVGLVIERPELFELATLVNGTAS